MKRGRYEASDIAPKNIGFAALSLFGGIALSAGVVAGLLVVLDHSRQKPAAAALETVPLAPPLPRLEIDGKVGRSTIEADAARKLEGYAWVDRSAGTVRVSIARAMQILAAHGWPDGAP